MRKSHNEQGYALLIVLFLIVFIMAVSAVFIRGTLGNAKQEIKVDESHLTVVAAEAGVDYYTWEINQFYAANQQHLYEELKKAFLKAIKKATDEEKDLESINYMDIQLDVLSEFIKIKFKPFLQVKVGGGQKKIGKEYSHSFTGFEIEEPKRDLGGAKISLKGNVEGQYKGESSLLDFDLVFIIPEININLEDKTGDPIIGSIVLPAPKEPLSPIQPKEAMQLVGIPKPNRLCKNSATIVNEECYIKSVKQAATDISQSSIVVDENLDSSSSLIKVNGPSLINIYKNLIGASFSINNSEMVIGNSLNFYEDVEMSNSLISIKNNIGDEKKPRSMIVNSVQMVVKGNIYSQHSTINTSILEVGGNQVISSNLFRVYDTNLHVNGNLDTRHGSFLNGSILSIGGDYLTPNGLDVQNNTNIFIGGNLEARNGSTLRNATLKIKGNYNTPNLLDAQTNTNISVGGNLEARNGSILENVVLLVNGYYNTPNKFELTNADVHVGGTVSGGSGDFEKTTLVAKKYEGQGINLKENSFLYADEINFTNDITLNNSKICAKKITIATKNGDSSPVYYLEEYNSWNKNNTNVFKLSSAEFQNQCNIGDGKQKPQFPDALNWEDPYLEKVEYK